MALTRRQRVRRVGILCLHCLRNLAFRNAGWKAGSYLRPDEQFWRNVDSNFLDVAVLEWDKLFAEKKGKHAWHKVVTKQDDFREKLLEVAGMNQPEFDAYAMEARAYRDWFIAHLDDREEMQIPTLRVMRETSIYLYNYLLEHEDDDGTFFDGFPRNAGRFYAHFLREGKTVYQE